MVVVRAIAIISVINLLRVVSLATAKLKITTQQHYFISLMFSDYFTKAMIQAANLAFAIRPVIAMDY